MDRFRTVHVQHRSAYYSDPSIRPMGMGEVLSACRKDGAEFPVEISLSPVEIKGCAFVWTAIRDVNVRERSIARFNAALQNKLIGVTGLPRVISICAWCKK